MSAIGRTLCAVLLGCSSAAPPASAPAATVSAVVAAPPAAPGLCDLEVGDMFDLFFESCDVFVPRFENAVSVQCRRVAPRLADAAVGIGGDCAAPPGDYQYPEDERRELARVSAAIHMSKELFAEWPHELPCDDLGREIWELEHDWLRKQPDVELGYTYTHMSGPDWQLDVARLSVGDFLFARALAPRLTSSGRQYLRKFLACEINARKERDDRVERRVCGEPPGSQ